MMNRFSGVFFLNAVICLMIALERKVDRQRQTHRHVLITSAIKRIKADCRQTVPCVRSFTR